MTNRITQKALIAAAIVSIFSAHSAFASNDYTYGPGDTPVSEIFETATASGALTKFFSSSANVSGVRTTIASNDYTYGPADTLQSEIFKANTASSNATQYFPFRTSALNFPFKTVNPGDKRGQVTA